MNRSRERARMLLQKARGDQWILDHLIDNSEAPERHWMQQAARETLDWAQGVIS